MLAVHPFAPTQRRAIFAAFWLAMSAATATAGPLTPPVAPRQPHVETLHGDSRSDDWFWLHEKTNPAVRQYLEAENAYAAQEMAPLADLQDALYKEMLDRIQQTDLSVPYRQGGFWYYTRTEEGKQYSIYCRKQGTLQAPEQIILDVNELAKGHRYTAVSMLEPSDDGALIAVAVDTTGYRQYALFVKDLKTGTMLPDTFGKIVEAVWAADNRTLFYTTEDAAKRPYRFYRHELGSKAPDVLVYEEADEKFEIAPERTRSGKFLLLDIASHTTSEVRYVAADQPLDAWRVVEPRVAGREYDLDHRGNQFYIRVNDTGRNFRLVWAPVVSPDRAHWTELLPHRDDVMLQGIGLFADFYMTSERRNGLPEIGLTDLTTGAVQHVTFPEPAYQASPSTNREFATHAIRYTYQSFVTPPSVYDYDVQAQASRLLKQTAVLGDYESGRYASERIFATAKDGTQVPVSLVYRKDMPRNGTAPLYLYGYGSYGSSAPVTFSSSRLSLLDRGFVYAVAHIRGGGELGKKWHDAGRMENKMNTFTDFVDCAEHLTAHGYGARDKVVIEGRSAGGLLIGATLNLRPDLFRAAIVGVPFVDVINTMNDATLPLTVGEFEEWGNPQIAAQYIWLKAYCPYTNLAARSYPTMLVRTSFNDSQVSYHEAAKYVAKLRALKTDRNPLLLLCNMGAGHGGASGRYDRLRDTAADYAWVLQQVGQVTGTERTAR
jgi:oligopeptidase B